MAALEEYVSNAELLTRIAELEAENADLRRQVLALNAEAGARSAVRKATPAKKN